MGKSLITSRSGRAFVPGVPLHTALSQQRRCDDDEGGHNHVNKDTLDAIEIHDGSNVGFIPVIVNDEKIEWQEPTISAPSANWQFVHQELEE